MKKELENVLIFSRSEEHARMIIDFWEKQGLKENWIPQKLCYYGLYKNTPLFASQSLIAGSDAKFISLEEAERRARLYMDAIAKAKRPEEIDFIKYTRILRNRK